MNRTLIAIIWTLLICGACFGQRSFQGLTPGVSTRSDVARALGQPVRSISPTLFEYKPPAGFAKVEVGYSHGTSLVERIEVYFIRPILVSALIEKFALREDAVAEDLTAQGNLRLYLEQALLVLTYASNESNAGVSQIGCYSRELFDNEVGRFITATRDNLPPADLRQMTGTWRTARDSLVEVRNNGEAVGLKPSEQAAARGAKVGDVVFSNAHAAGNLIVADYPIRGHRDVCPELRTLVQATIRVDRDGTKLTVSVPIYHIDKDSNGNCTVTDKLQRYRLVKWTRVSSRISNDVRRHSGRDEIHSGDD